MIPDTLDIGFWNYDRVKALTDGSVSIEGVTSRFHSSRIVTEIFEKAVRERAVQVSELGLTYFLRTFHDGPSPFVALPVFLNRAFRHGAIYINKASGIRTPADLTGKRIGELALYSHDAGIQAKGVLMDEFGFRPEANRWLVGGIDFPMKPVDFVPRPVPAGVEVEYAPKEADLGKMLEEGDIDALISADIPKCILEHSPRVGRLFEDYVQREHDYYRKSGVFPIMHGLVVTRELADEAPGLVKAIYKSFCDAKDAAAEQYRVGMTFNNMANMHPWLTSLLADNQALLGNDWWPYGIKANRAAIDTLLRYHHEQGITPRRLQIDELFFDGLLDT